MVKPIEWMRAVRDHEPKPGPQSMRYAVLWGLALRLGGDGTGFCSVRQLCEDVEVSERTARGHLAWARKSELLEQTRRGHRLGNGSVVASEWKLTRAQPATRDLLRSTGNPSPVDESSTGKPGTLNRQATNPPRGPLQEDALQSRPAALADAVLAVLPDRLAGMVTRSTLEQACAELSTAWTPEAVGRAAQAATWPADARGGIVVGWIRSLGEPPRTKPASRPKAKRQCPDCGDPIAVDGSCGCDKQKVGAA
jgi:hypothetical protein